MPGPAQRNHYLTDCLTIAYDADAACPTWEAFLWRIMGGRPPLSADADALRGDELEAYTAAQTRAQTFCAFLQRVLGQCLTGDVSEQDLYIFYGTGANGKSTLLNTIMALLGTYAMKGTAELLMTPRNDRHPTERADLYGKRLVATIETQEAGRLNETFIKEATGGDPIRARRMREDFWEFLPTHTMLLATNHKPEIRGTDYAIWRRIKLIPFTVTMPDDEQDPALPEKLAKELPGILAWMVRGCLDWQTHGLRPPEEVLLATQAYKQEQDVFEAFLASECFRTPSARSSAAELYSTYETWCKDNDLEPLKKRAFGMRLGDSGCQPAQGTGGRREWVGIGLAARGQEDTRYGT
jgi:putative DNA primase/helicase